MAAKKVGIGHQNFEQLIQANCFYIDKTDFIREWWENKDMVTLVTCWPGTAFVKHPGHSVLTGQKAMMYNKK